jgi:hypothetical protein
MPMPIRSFGFTSAAQMPDGRNIGATPAVSVALMNERRERWSEFMVVLDFVREVPDETPLCKHQEHFRTGSLRHEPTARAVLQKIAATRRAEVLSRTL